MNPNYGSNFRNNPSEAQGLTYYDTYGTVRNVSFAPANGTKLFLNYGYLISGTFSPEDGTILLTFTNHEVRLKGNNLGPLFDSFAMQSLQHIATVDERYAETMDEAASYVMEIKVRDV